ncbi:MAG: VTT domain-containing protein [Candidatus Bathyarchaeota archaeon]|nr:VTT domain-containing protein [Candidatus Bathyarchaeota archaeon]MCX8177104.1 VTT domain-containing protein [Candidatus Bathyarchaeota archaeon]MDW8193725.1 VTT domain-containing protein [Nitrososphaerota archaeon]
MRMLGRLSEALSVPWVRSSLILGGVLAAIGVVLVLIFKFFNLAGSPLFMDAKAFIMEYGLVGIFLATILAGTVVPVGSPALVVAAASFGVHPLLLAIVATAGFTVGMTINYALAYGLGRPFVLKKLGMERLEEISALWNHWGWVIYTLFGIIPVLPVEFLALFCGLIKARFSRFLILSFIPRLIVFALLAYFGVQLGWWLGIM